jgi:hypothetical protein
MEAWGAGIERQEFMLMSLSRDSCQVKLWRSRSNVQTGPQGQVWAKKQLFKMYH